MTPEEFRTLGHEVIDWIADYRAQVGDRAITPDVEPGEIRRSLPVHPPQQGEPFERVLRDFEQLIVPGITHWQHPSFFGYFPSNGNLASVLGDFLSTGLGVIGLSWQASPALTELEEVVMEWLRDMLALPATFTGVIQDTASTSSLIALICARERATQYALTHGGLQASERPLTVYVSAQAHSSVDKAALLAGFGRDNVRAVPGDANFAMRPDALAEMIAADREAGRLPTAIVATTGTTTSTALDPIAAIAPIAAAEGCWLHVDAAMAGSAMILPECRWMWDGVEHADSVVLNPHKWLGAAFDCSAYYVRDPEHLIRVMSTNPSYLQSTADGSVKNYRDWGIPLGRRFRALKLWFLIRDQGISGLQERLRRDIENAQWLAARVAESPDWRLLASVPLQTLCIRHEPHGLTGDALDAHTKAWCERVNRSGEAYLTPALLNGQWMVRVAIGAEQTERVHVAALWELLQRVVQE